MTDLLNEAAERSIRYMKDIDVRRVFPAHEAIEKLASLEAPMPETPASPGDVLRELDGFGSPATVANMGPRYFGFVVGGALPISVAAHWLATAWDQNAAATVMSPAACHLEKLAGRWLLDVLGLPDGSSCSFVTGTTAAHMTSLAAARHKVLAGVGWDVEQRGLGGAPPVQVLASEEVHITVNRALSVLGLGRESLVRVPTDAQGRLRADRLPALRAPAIMIAQAGNVNTGAFDPIDDVCTAAAKVGAWVHVDGAFGLWAAAAPSTQPLVQGLDRADSWATDGHKWLNVPYDSGLAIIRDPASVRAALAMTASYLVPSTEDPMDATLEMSRRARGVDIWATLKTLGRSGVVDLITRCCALARRFAERLSAAGVEVLNDVVLNQVLVSFGHEERTRRTVERIQKEGTCWCGTTRWKGRMAMRISVSGWKTTTEDVDRSVDAMLRCWAETA
ncbi:MAG: pyridoxal-dependent decarboxylase [Myxococcota bacterium]